jgi:hypothetical protein
VSNHVLFPSKGWQHRQFSTSQRTKELRNHSSAIQPRNSIKTDSSTKLVLLSNQMELYLDVKIMVAVSNYEENYVVRNVDFKKAHLSQKEDCHKLAIRNTMK